MNDDDAFRERLAALSPEQIGQLYDATAEDWQRLGITRQQFVGNMAAKAQFDAAVRPFELVLEAYIAMSDRAEELRAIRRDYFANLERLRGPEHAGRPINDVLAEAAASRTAYNAAIELVGDDRVTAAQRAYDRAVTRESELFGRRLR